tara:strand:+ start:200 stop:595 length:396 start_codon:yes stop_codon:yes gene_type:complete
MSKIENDFYSLLLPLGENQPSPLATWVEASAHSQGRAIATEIKTTLMGQASGRARLQTAIEGDMAQDALTVNNPLVAGLLESFPTVKKRALKNPGVIDFLINKLASGSGGSQPPNNGPTDNFAQRLNKYRG